jgi:SNF2 family DNA or RNA helicase
LNLREDYKNLNQTSKILLQIISIGYRGLSQKKIVQFYMEFIAEKKNSNSTTVQELKSTLESLEASGFIETNFKNLILCHPEISESIFRDSIQTHTFDSLSNLIKYDILNKKDMGEEEYLSYGKIQIYRGLEDPYSQFPKKTYLLDAKESFLEIIYRSTFSDFDSAFLDSIPFHPKIKQNLYKTLILSFLNGEIPEHSKWEYINSKSQELEESLAPLYAILQILRAEEPDIQTQLDRYSSYFLFWNPYIQESIKLLPTTHEEINDIPVTSKKLSHTKRDTNPLSEIGNYAEEDYFSFLVLFFYIQDGQKDHFLNAERYCKEISAQRNHLFSKEFEAWSNFLEYARESELLKPIMDESLFSSSSMWSYLTFLLISFWLQNTVRLSLLETCSRMADLCFERGHLWFAFQIYFILDSLGYNQLDLDRLNSLGKRYVPIALIYTRVEPWQSVLYKLSIIQKKISSREKVRMIWEVKFDSLRQSIESITPREQILSSSFEWIEGRLISLKQLVVYPEKFPYVSKKDLEIIRNITNRTSSLQGDFTYYIDLSRPEFLLGHPLIFEEGKKIPLEIQKQEPGLLLQRGNTSSLHLSLNPTPCKGNSYRLIEKVEGIYTYYEFSEEILNIYEGLGDTGVVFPETAEGELLDILRVLSESISVQSELEKPQNIEFQEIIHTGRLTVRILPFHTGFSISIGIQIISRKEIFFPPCEGSPQVWFEVDGKKWIGKRNLVAERENLDGLLNNSSTIYSLKEISPFSYRLETPLDCLEFMTELEKLQKYADFIFPEGNPFSITNIIDPSLVQIFIHEQESFFYLKGSIQTHPQKTVDIQTLFSRFSRSIDRFVPLQENLFLCFTKELWQLFKDLQMISIIQKKEILFSYLSLPLLMELLTQFPHVKYDATWKEKVSYYHSIQNKIPVLPNGWKGNFRSYQREGFEWMIRTLEWGGGACLADDMGLGKTLQSLAVLLYYAKDGPCLVVAPTSVVSNWEKESSQVAPDLRLKILGSADKSQILLHLEPYDLVLCSYGVLQLPEVTEALSRVSWNLVVLDEAQMIKNSSSKRAESVLLLKAKYKLLTTGTPIENHLGELWSLFHFLNPTLLGSKELFKRKYADPIEKNQDQEALESLQKWVRPFILRRLKKDVLLELPAKTEIILHVELSQEEREFYNSLRSHALMELTESSLPESQKRIRILAELMKLRRACCHPCLVDPSLSIESSKFLVFQEILRELLENKHRALVFSQFVDHLQILKSYLNHQGISLQYLDGSSSPASRKKSIENFQQGEGDVFLISLKAGGSGLNLTGADYVLHMDPWWNPAVEDQASDRAYRIGQKQPVTVYKLITEGTIEKTISHLHLRKRELAGSILEGVGGSRFPLSSKELVDFLEEI